MPLLCWIVSNVILALLLVLAARVAQRLAWHAVAHTLWVFALVKLVTPPLVDVPLGRSPQPTACALGTCGCAHHAPAPGFARDTLPWLLLAVWSAGAGATVWLARRRLAWFRLLASHARPAPPEWQALASRLASELSIRRPPEVLAVPGRLPPLVVPGLVRPRVLVPTDLLDKLNAHQKTALLMHELVHIKRGDHLVRVLEFAVRVVYWWLPGVAVIGRQLRACEESCCDAAVVERLPEARRGYASLLLDVIDFAEPLPAPQATAMSTANDLERRLRAILDPAQTARRTGLVRVFAVGLACALLPLGLRYDSVGDLDRETTSVGTEPAEQAAPLPGRDDDERRPKSAVCCPS
jgi:beta-lactamase regulating signal transducer with metallopeptidase domain